MTRIAALALTIPVLMAQGERSQLSVTAVRHWNTSGVTRVAIEVSGDFKYRSDRLHEPERIYFDVLNARPSVQGHRFVNEAIDDKLLLRLRVAETAPGVTRIVLDLGPSVEVNTSQLSNPNRLMVELRNFGTPGATPTTEPAPVPVSTPKLPPPPSNIRTEPPALVPKAPPVIKAEIITPPPMVAEPSKSQMAPSTQPKDAAATAAVESPKSVPPRRPEPSSAAARTVEQDTATSDVPKSVAEKPSSTPATVRTTVAKTSEPAKVPDAPKPSAEKTPAASPGLEVGRAARRTSTGDTSLVRALGLKVGRVVIDPGHGGHDQGTEGPHGLLEKELVLDVSLRLGKLIEDRMNAEVIYTRTDDTFIPLEGRTALANDKKADLFLSIHANSSPVPRIAGVETYYLNFTNAKDAMDVATRENATAQKSIFDLRDIIQKITLHDKAEESHEFASRLQSALFAFSAKNFPAEKNRGVKKAPFVVLIGASMPSVLAEIGFLSNTREESLLKRPDYRQKLAEALYRGVSKYAESLSHFQVAQNQSGKP